ncbi:hypothetical protein Misp01_67190 [Microtetraspora sp. NBRC 13810]|uniref:copper resistance protein CopC n=1 Tax=Microtetraspora sp. NBRC 13810 TaxID=3030990 RepID=UPI0024A0E7BD|nr:copper resistance protein CopC [Microtetraspora sp. NBRC 13810]GLW11591.1 hypothetical protein Misp01_67190 [Microtetraspora sp. NBRC 13810]
MLFRAAFALFAALTVALFHSTAAQAHDILKSSKPAKDAKVTTLEEVELEFNNPVTFPRVVVLDASGEQVQEGEAQLHGKKVVQRLRAVISPGKYTIGFRVISSDGHPRSGEVPFTVAAAPTPTSSESPSEQAGGSAPAQAPPSIQPVQPSLTPQAEARNIPAGGGSTAVLLLGAGVIAALTAGVFVLVGRRRRPDA